jgi:hypothetical protein
MERHLISQTRANATIWLRRVHGWIGLWGAALGLLFGFSGIWLNHRAVLPLHPAAERDNSQLALPDPRPADAQAMAAWLQAALSLPQPAGNVRVEPAKPAPWAEKAAGHGGGHRRNGAEGDRARAREREADAPVAASAPVEAAAASAPDVPMQPEHWTFNFGAPRTQIQAEYWVGNRAVSVRRTDNGVVATLTNLHKGIGMPVAWILLVDTLAGSLILLSLSGIALWVLTRRKRTVGLAILGSALAVTAGLAIAHL